MLPSPVCPQCPGQEWDWAAKGPRSWEAALRWQWSGDRVDPTPAPAPPPQKPSGCWPVALVSIPTHHTFMPHSDTG